MKANEVNTRHDFRTTPMQLDGSRMAAMLVQARVRWAAGMIKAFVGEAIGDPRMEVEGTIAKAIGREDIEDLKLRSLGSAMPATAARPLFDDTDIAMLEQAAERMEVAASHYREAVRRHRHGDAAGARFYVCVGQGLCSQVSDLAARIGSRLWRGMKGN